MGLLDDAIREHLELKRAHGADPTEVEAQEREALGAPRQAEFASPDGGQDEPPPVEADAPVEPPPEVAEPEPDSEPEAQAGDAWFEDQPEEVPASETLEHQQPAAEPEADDVLEETPEFLQETPEHDRLWFEQRPPRDFDWDK